MGTGVSKLFSEDTVKEGRVVAAAKLSLNRQLYSGKDQAYCASSKGRGGLLKSLLVSSEMLARDTEHLCFQSLFQDTPALRKHFMWREDSRYQWDSA